MQWRERGCDARGERSRACERPIAPRHLCDAAGGGSTKHDVRTARVEPCAERSRQASNSEPKAGMALQRFTELQLSAAQSNLNQPAQLAAAEVLNDRHPVCGGSAISEHPESTVNQ